MSTNVNAELRLAIRIAGSSNDEHLGAEMFLAGVAELIKNGLTAEVAAGHVFETAWHFLMTFADMPNRDMPRRLFGGIVWGVLRTGDKIDDLTPYLVKIVMAPKFPPFMFVTGGKPEAEIKRLVREWTWTHRKQAIGILAEIRKEMTEGRMSKCPPPISHMIGESILYSLMAHLPFVSKVGIGLTIDEIPEE